MYLTLKRIEELRPAELGLVAASWYAVAALRRAWMGYVRIGGFEKAWEAFLRELPTWYPNVPQRAFDRLCEQIEQGDWILVHDPSWPPLAPALNKQDERYQPARDVWSPAFRHRLSTRLETLDREQREREALESRNQPSSAAPETEPAAGPGNRAATLGPHAGDDGTGLKDNSFKTQHEAAASASQRILPTSIAEDREYGGMIYRNKDGTYGYTGPVKGEEGSVNPGGPKSVPPGTTAVAYWHTHGAYNPNYDSENFSNYYDQELGTWVGDIPYAKHHGIDAYVVTPEGNFKYYSVGSNSEQLLGKLSTK